MRKRYSERGATPLIPLVVSAVIIIPAVATSFFFNNQTRTYRSSAQTASTPGACNVTVNTTASPSSGPAPLNGIDVTVSVGGTATGSITYYVNCQGNDGSTAEGSFGPTSVTSHTFTNVCSYATAGTYSIKGRADRGTCPQASQLATVTVGGTALPTKTRTPTPRAATPTRTRTPTPGAVNPTKTKTPTPGACNVTVNTTASPSSGPAPLNGIDVTVSVGGTATGSITYYVNCQGNDGSTAEGSFGPTSVTSHTFTNVCSYATAGTYSIKGRADRGTCPQASQLATVTVNTTASPSSGPAPLNGIDVTVSVGGTATGSITYYVNCQGNDGSTAE